MAANTSEQKLQNELDFTSTSFNALKALYSKSLQPPVPNAHIFNNINEYAKSLKAGKNEPKQTAEGDLAGRLKNIAENKLNKLRNRNRDPRKLEHLMKVKSQTDGIVEKVAMLEKTKKKGQQMNVLERMEEKYKEGPLSILYNCIEKKTKLKVWTRKLKGLRGVCVGYLIAFDKHMNLAMMDVDEMFAIEEEVVIDPAESLAESLKKLEEKKEKKRRWRRRKRERLRNNERMVEDRNNGNEGLRIDFKAKECSGTNMGLFESSTSMEIENSRGNISGDKDGSLDRQSKEKTIQSDLRNDSDNENQDNPSDRLRMSLKAMECSTTSIGLLESNASIDTKNNERNSLEFDSDGFDGNLGRRPKEDSSQNYLDSEGFTMEREAKGCCTTNMGLFESNVNIDAEGSELQLKKRERLGQSGERTMNEEGDGRDEGLTMDIKLIKGNEYSTTTNSATIIGLVESNISIVDENSETNSLKNNDGVADSLDCQANDFGNESLRDKNIENQNLRMGVKATEYSTTISNVKLLESDVSMETENSQISTKDIPQSHDSIEKNSGQQQVDKNVQLDLKKDLDNAKEDNVGSVSPKTDTQAKPLDFVNKKISVDNQESQKPLRHIETKADVFVGDKDETIVQRSIGGEQTQDSYSDGEDRSTKMSESFRSSEEEEGVELMQEESDKKDLSTNDEGNKEDSFGEETTNDEVTIYDIMKEVKRTESELKEAGTLLSNDKNTNTYPYKPYSILQGNVLAMEFDEGSQDSVMFDRTVDREGGAMGVQAVTLHHKITYGMEETRGCTKQNCGVGSLVKAVRDGGDDGNDDDDDGDEGGGEDVGYDNYGNNSDGVVFGSLMSKVGEKGDGDSCDGHFKHDDGNSNNGGREDVGNDSEGMEGGGSLNDGGKVDGDDGSRGGFCGNDDGNNKDGEDVGYDNDGDYSDDIEVDCVMKNVGEKDDGSCDSNNSDGNNGDGNQVDDGCGDGNNDGEYVGNTDESDGDNDDDGVGYDGDSDGTIAYGGEMVDSATNKVVEKADVGDGSCEGNNVHGSQLDDVNNDSGDKVDNIDGSYGDGGDGISDDGIIGLGKGTDDHSGSHDGNYGSRADEGTSHDDDGTGIGNENNDGTSIVAHGKGSDNGAGSHGGDGSSNIGNDSNDGGDSIEGIGILTGTDGKKEKNIDEKEELCSTIKDEGNNGRDEEYCVARKKVTVRLTDVSQSGNMEITKQENVEEKEEGELSSSSDDENLEECGDSRQDKKQHKADLKKVLAPKLHEKKSNIRLKSTGTTSKTQRDGDKEKDKRRNSISCTRETSSEIKDKRSDEKRGKKSEKERRRSLVEKGVDNDDRSSRRVRSKGKTEGRKISLSKERKSEKDNIKTIKERRSSSTSQKLNVTDIGDNTDDSSSRTVESKDTAKSRKISTSKGRERKKDNVKTIKERRSSSTSQKRYATEKEVDNDSSLRKVGTKENAENRKSLESKSKEDSNKTIEKKRNSTTFIKLDTSSSSRDAKSKDSMRKSNSITSSHDKRSDLDDHEKKVNKKRAKVSCDKTSREDQIHHKESGKQESRSSSESSTRNLSRNKEKESDDKHKTQVRKSRYKTSPVDGTCKRTTRKSSTGSESSSKRLSKSSKEIMNKSSETQSKGKDVEPIRNVSKDSSKGNDRKSASEKSSVPKVRRSSRVSVETKSGNVSDKKKNISDQEVRKKDLKRTISKTKDKTDSTKTTSGKKPELVKHEDSSVKREESSLKKGDGCRTGKTEGKKGSCKEESLEKNVKEKVTCKNEDFSLKSGDKSTVKREESCLKKYDSCGTGQTVGKKGSIKEDSLKKNMKEKVTCSNSDNKSKPYKKEQSVSKKSDNERKDERKSTRNAAKEKSFSRDEKPREEQKLQSENDETHARRTQKSIKITSNVSEECRNKIINTTKSLESGKEKLCNPDEGTQKKNNGSVKQKDGSITQKVKTETLTGKEAVAKRKLTVEEYKSRNRSESKDWLKSEANKTSKTESKTVNDKNEKSIQPETLKQSEKLHQPTRSKSQKQIYKGDEEKLSGKRKREDTPVRSQKVRKTTEMDAKKESVKFVKTKEAKLPGNVVTVRILKVDRGKALVLKRRHVNQLFIRGDNIIMVAHENIGTTETKL